MSTIEPINRERMLEQDRHLPRGQAYAVISIVTPPELRVEKREKTMMLKFLEYFCEKIPNLNPDVVKGEYELFREDNYDSVVAESDLEQSSLYAIKICGAYPSEKIAVDCAKSIHERCPYYDYGVAPLGNWLPIDVGLSSKDSKYTLDKLQELMDSYHDNQESAAAEFDKRVRSFNGPGEIEYANEDDVQPDVHIAL